ncbi:hypothetical protein [Bradyrhizobium sp. SYSU BS000235]|uniref:hypothetical protein n=1 Tax=Bradyrhizobium sp. SYSU BS000235 TaxID=3411332 RepID=UPI003C70DFD1
MILGMSLQSFTVFHLILSMIGIAFGFIVAGGILASNRLPGWTALFLLTTILTSATGFLFPFTKLLPSHIVAIISLVLLAVALYAFYAKDLSGVWRPVYIVTAMRALWFNVFVLIAQSFLKVGLLNVYAPTGAEPPFAITQGVVLVFFILAIIAGIRRFRPA